MAEIQDVLTRKMGPLPLWGWAAAGGGLLAVVYLNKRGSASPTGAASAAGQAANVPYVPSPIIVTPPSMPPGTSSVNPTPSPTPTAPPLGGSGSFLTITPGPYAGGQGVLRTTSSPPPSGAWGSIVVPPGTRVQQSGDPITYNDPKLGGIPMIPVSYLGGTYYASSYDVTPLQLGGLGGGGSVLRRISKSGAGRMFRFAGPHAHQQYVAAGMGGGGHAQLQQLSARTGVSIGRLMALNPGHWQGHGRRPVAIHIG